MQHVRRVVTSVVGASLAATLLVALVPSLHFAYRRPALHAALETAASLVASLALFLVVGRLRRGLRLNELLLACALGFLTVASVFFVLLPALSGGLVANDALAWDGRIWSVLGALLLAAAALAPPRRIGSPAAVLLARAAAPTLAVAAALAVVIERGVVPGAGSSVVSRATSWPDLDNVAWPQLLLHAVAAVAFAVAAVGFLRGAERLGDELYAWLSVTATLAAFSQVNYFLYPTRTTDWVYTGDAFRLLAYVVLLVGTLREITSYWRARTEAAVLEERRGFARDLHDGLAQEIAYIGRNLRALTPQDEEQAERLDRVRRAAERAQLESRRVVAALSTPVDEPLEIVLARETSDVATRYGVELELDLATATHVSRPRAESLVRIACEAIANAARHSGTRQVAVTLDRSGDRVRLRVHDRGCGFDPESANGGFGLVSMRERAKAVGGRLRVDSSPGRGTTVEVAL